MIRQCTNDVLIDVPPLSETFSLQAMDPKPFRKFLAEYMYSTPLALMTDACNGGPAEEFVEWSLALRKDRHSRHTLAEVRASLRKQVKPRWWNTTANETFSLWRVMSLRCVPRSEQCYVPDLSLGRKSRRLLSSTGVTSSRPPNVADEAAKAAEDLWAGCYGQQVCMWIDNWYRKQYTVDPLNQDKSLSLVVTAILHVPIHPMYPGHLTRPQLVGNLDTRRMTLLSTRPLLLQAMRHLTSSPVERTFIRVPLDVVRHDAISPQWRPFYTSDNPPGTHSELLKVLEMCSTVQQHTTHSMPLCVDMKIHGAVLKMLYSPSYERWDMHRFLRAMPLMYGIWHPYKHCLTLIYRRFYGLLMLLERPELKFGDKVPTRFKVAHMERTIASLLLLPNDVKNRLEIRRAMLMVHSERPYTAAVQRGIEQLTALRTLINEYVPAIFMCGHYVRWCHWDGLSLDSGSTAFDALGFAFHIMLPLVSPHQNKVEYIRSLCAAMLSWQPWHHGAASACFGEEMCEAMLAKVSLRCKSHSYLTGVENTLHLFLTTTLTSQRKHKLASNIPEKMAAGIRNNCLALIRTAGDDTLPLCKWTVGKSVIAVDPKTDCDSEGLGFPLGPTSFDWAAIVYAACFRNSAKHLFGPSKVSDEMRVWLDANVPLRVRPAQIENQEQRILLEQLLPQPRPQPQPKPKPKARFIGPVRPAAPAPEYNYISDDEADVAVPDIVNLVDEDEPENEIDVDDDDWIHNEVAAGAEDFDL